ncbi:MAG: hypothetical protein F4218_06425 [Synechococcus sp. SB0677_bin_5]|nr:hypothetical protein [Synechococcus sp. SB0677_bin_5]
MAIRLLECRRVLKTTGSIYLHCDPTMSHYLKALMDCIFGEDNFRNEIVWHYGKMSNTSRNFPSNHDTLLRYSKAEEFVFTPIKGGESEYRARFSRFLKGNKVLFGTVRHLQDKLILGRIRKIRTKLKRDLKDNDVLFDFDIEYKIQLDVIYVPTIKGNSSERIGYPTQKPVALLERIIRASSHPGDIIILDPFCGCATTCVAAERLGRQWIGIDVSVKAYELVKIRLTREAADPGNVLKYQNEIHLRTDPPTRTDLGADHRERKFVYVISHPSYPGEYKIGIARNWKSRLNAYQTSDPDRQYEIEFRLETPRFRETERYIHDLFPNKHEWVQGDLQEIITEIRDFANRD